MSETPATDFHGDLAGKPSGNPKKKSAGIGMPAALYLQHFGRIVYEAFGEFPYHVGSSLDGETWRDVDIRLMLDAEKYAAMGFGDPARPHENERWCAYVMAFSALGRQITGLPIDFQIQETKTANKDYPKCRRSALILRSLNRAGYWQENHDAGKPAENDSQKTMVSAHNPVPVQ